MDPLLSGFDTQELFPPSHSKDKMMTCFNDGFLTHGVEKLTCGTHRKVKNTRVMREAQGLMIPWSSVLSFFSCICFLDCTQDSGSLRRHLTDMKHFLFFFSLLYCSDRANTNRRTHIHTYKHTHTRSTLLSVCCCAFVCHICVSRFVCL